MDRRCAEAYRARALLYLNAGAVEVADFDYSTAVEIYGASGEARLGKATTSLILRRWDDTAIESTCEILEGYEIFDARFLRGLAYGCQERYDQAIGEFQECLKMKPNSAIVHNAIGTVCLDRGDCDGAVAAFDRAIAADPMPLFYVNCACALRLKGDYALSLEKLDKTMNHTAYQPSTRGTASGLGPIAVNFFLRSRKSLGGVEGTSYPWEVRGLSLAGLGRGQEAIEALNKAVDLGSSNGLVYAERGKQKVRLQQYGDGISDIDQGFAMGLHPKIECFFHYARAVADYSLGNYAQATEGAARSLASPMPAENPKARADVHWIAFLADERSGDGTAASEALAAALALAPAYADRLDGSYVTFVNKTNRPVCVCPRDWIDFNNKFSYVGNSWWIRKSTIRWKVDPGQSVTLSRSGHPFRMKALSAWMESKDRNRYNKYYIFKFDGKQHSATFESEDSMFPQ